MAQKFCSFTYAAFALAFVYFVLFILVLRYLLNLMRSNSTKKRAQKIFLAILIAQTLIRVLYFLLFPLSSTACSPSMQGDDRPETTRSPSWWIHLLGNLPAMLFLSAFSVLVYTFARIYHEVLLAGVRFQERRFRLLTAFLVLLNLVSLVSIFGDWAHATNRHNKDLSPFVTMLLACITGVSITLAILFLGYGSLLFFQVQSIIRASAESVTGTMGGGAGGFTNNTAGTAYAHKDYTRLGGEGARDIERDGMSGHAYSSARGGMHMGGGAGSNDRPASMLLPAASNSLAGSLAAPLMPALNFPSETGTGFTPTTHAHLKYAPRRSPGAMSVGQGSGIEGEGEGERERERERDPDADGDEEGSFETAPMYLAPNVGAGSGLNSSPTKDGAHMAAPGSSAPVGGMGALHAQGQSPSSSGAGTAHYSLSGFLSPNLPIRNANGGGMGSGEVIAAHSYRSSVSASYTPLGSAAAHTAAGGSGSGHSAATEGSAMPQIPSGYASSVSPEYSKVPASAKPGAQHRAIIASPNGTTVLSAATPGTAGSGAPITHTDALAGSVPFAQAGAFATPQHAFATPRRGTSSLARQSPAPTPGAHRQTGSYQMHHDAPEGEEDYDSEAPGAPGGGAVVGSSSHARVVQNGLTNAHYYQHDEGGVTSIYPNVSRHSSMRGNGAASQQMRPSTDPYLHRGEGVGSADPGMDAALLPPPVAAPPPNPMRKIAVIAGICVACLIARAGLIVGMISTGQDFTAVTTVVYFMLSEVAPLFFMLKVFNTPTPLVHVLGAGGGGPGSY